ncbi:MAG TPA: serine hydrolase [Chitinophagales bacterium]|nr:serine hydrolase [Chitinophagales bacterium]
MKIFYTFFLFLLVYFPQAQTLYFPPLSGNTWDTLSPTALGWCQPRIDTLYAYLQQRHSQGFIVLKDGKIVLEKYFGTFTKDSIHYWASAGKSLTAALVGVAAQENLLSLEDSASRYLGSGWSSAPANKESLVKIKHLLSMTSGFRDDPAAPCDAEDTAATCLQYIADAGTYWTYQTGAYKKLHKIMSIASSSNYNVFTNNRIGTHIGMSGLWVNGVFYSVPRGMARFGLMILNKGTWANDTILKDPAYYNAMVNTSQNLNEAYGYLWWLNGKSSVMAPGLQTVFQRELFANAPDDMFMALGKNDQKIYVVPSRNMVVVRVGDAAYTSQAAFSDFDNELWGLLDSMSCDATGIGSMNNNSDEFALYPNPATDKVTVMWQSYTFDVAVYNAVGQKVLSTQSITNTVHVDCSQLPGGIYYLQLNSGTATKTEKLIIK